MADVFTRAKRSAIMSRIRGKNTNPEIVVRKLVHSLGFRFALHKHDLPGTPDLVLPKHRKVIFVHGCFWHGHARCRRAILPSTNKKFWYEKIAGNKVRDVAVKRELRRGGWGVLVVWQCETKQRDKLIERIQSFLTS